MPKVAAWIDELRAAFGREVIDAAIRQGMRDGSFCARENGHVVGCNHARPAELDVRRPG